jgi:tripartite-type tricarboxylate transporter receptor subunit TctC
MTFAGKWLRRAMAVSLGIGLVAAAQAEAYPNKPIRFLVPYSAGGGIDLISRAVAVPLSERFKQPILIENKPGANGVLATREAIRSPADGYTLLIGVPATIAINPSVYKLNFDPLKDLQPIAQLAVAHFVIVTSSTSGIHSLPELIAQAKANPGKYSFASYGNGSASHLAGQMLNTMAGIDASHIPYKGSASALPDVVSGRVSFMFDVVANVLPHVQSGRLKVIAVASEQALPQFPGVPTAASVVPGLSVEGWVGIFAPAAMPSPLVAQWSSEINTVLRNSELKQRLAVAGFEVTDRTPEQMRDVIRKDYATYARAARDAGLHND